MKVKVEEVKPDFSPVKVEIVLESAKELQHLWHTLNVSESVVRKFGVSDSMQMPYFSDGESTPGFKLWKAIDDICTDKGLKYEHEED